MQSQSNDWSKKYSKQTTNKKNIQNSTFTNELLTEMSTCLYFTLSFPFTLHAKTISQLSQRSHDRSRFNKSLMKIEAKNNNQQTNKRPASKKKNRETIRQMLTCLCFFCLPGLLVHVFVCAVQIVIWPASLSLHFSVQNNKSHAIRIFHSSFFFAHLLCLIFSMSFCLLGCFNS